MRKSPLLPVSLITSLFLHGLFIGSSYYLWVPGSSAVLENTTKMFNIQASTETRAVETIREVVSAYAEKLKFETPGDASREMLGKKLRKTEAVQLPDLPDLVHEKTIEMEAPEKKSEPGESWETITEAVSIPKRKPFNKETRVELDVFQPLEAARDHARPGQVPLSSSNQTVFGRVNQSLLTAISDPVREVLRTGAELPQARPDKKFEALDEFLSVRLWKYRDPVSGQGYFKISIQPGHLAQDVEIIPKEVNFLIDASLSIGRKRLNAFAEGIQTSLMRLNPQDRFNIMTFKDRIEKFAPAAVHADGVQLQAAAAFLDKLRASERTDIYGALLESMQTEPTIVPSYLILLSDGKPTFGMTSSAQVIQDIARMNSGQRAIFAFTGGRKVNRYMMDFLAYQNRGWAEYTPDRDQIAEKIAGLYQKISNPILIGARYQLSQMNPAEVYPKFLPDIYRDSEFVLYGLYQHEKKFSMRILGQANAKRKELIFVEDLSRATQGTEAIARGWAFNKIYYLISRITAEGRSDVLKDEIKRLSKAYGIETPYSFRKMK